MNHYLSVFCLLAVVALGHGNAVGYGYGLGGYGLAAPLYRAAPVISPYYAPAAISTASMIKAAPIPVIKTIAAPVYSAPLVLSKPLISAPLAYGYPYGYGYGLAKAGYPYSYGYGLAKAGYPYSYGYDLAKAGYPYGYGYGLAKAGYGYGLDFAKGYGYAPLNWGGYGYGYGYGKY